MITSLTTECSWSHTSLFLLICPDDKLIFVGLCTFDLSGLHLTSSSSPGPPGLLGSYSVTTMSDSIGSGEGVSEWMFMGGAGQLHSRSGRGCEG